jgi:FkbM family methyltransferase
MQRGMSMVNVPRISGASMLAHYARLTPALVRAMRSDTVAVGGLHLRIPGSRTIRASVLAGNVRVRAIIDAVVRPGATVVDVGANIGVIAAFAACRVGAGGAVVAIEPAQDNLTVLRDNLRRNGFAHVRVVAGAAGRQRGKRELYLRGGISAVNSLFPESCYASVTGITSVEVVRVDDMVDRDVDLVKIDVEGAELDVLGGMPRLLAQPSIALIVEWHPTLQRAAGYEADGLPRMLLDAGFAVHAVGHTKSRELRRDTIDALADRLLRARRPVELFCVRK